MRSCWWRSVVVCTLAVLAGWNLIAQQHAFRQFTTKDGLAQSQVRSMAQDGNGFLWLGTLGGVSRFDGHEFVNHALQEGLPEAHVSATVVDANGTMWMGAGANLVRVKGRQLITEPLPSSASGARILALAVDHSGRIIVGTDGAGLYVRDERGLRPYTAYPTDTALHVRAMMKLRDGRLLIGHRNGLLVGDENGFVPVTLGTDQPGVGALCEAPDGSWWVGTIGEGVIHISPDGQQTVYDQEDGLLLNTVRCLLLDDEGRLWIGTKLGLNMIDQSGRMRVFTIHQGLPNDNIFCAFQDREGGLWFGTDGAGVLRYTGDRFVTFTVKDGLCSDLIMCVVTDTLGDLWLGTYDNGICRMDGMAMVNTVDGLPNNSVWCGLTDDQGRLWFGTSDGLVRIVRGVVDPLPDPLRLAGQRVLSMLGSPDGTIWCGTRDGLYAVMPDGALQHYPAGQRGPGRSVRSIIRGRDGTLWLATEQGLVSFRNGAFKTYTRSDGSSDHTIISLALDQRDRIWAGTTNGVLCFDGSTARTLRFANDFGSNYIGLLMADGAGTLWAGTNNGLYHFDPDALLADPKAHEKFTMNDGLRSLEFNQNAGHLDAQGRCFMGTTGGLLFHRTERDADRTSSDPPALHITGVRSFLQVTDWKGRCDSLDANGLPLGLRLPYRRNYLTFDYTGISLGSPEHVLYRYRLNGLDQDWLPPTDARSASYSNLPHGDHDFEVMASTDGVNWGPGVRFTFHVDAPFWLRWWFFAGCVGLVSAAGFGIHRYREVQRERRERTRQLMLRSRMLQLEQQALNANMNRHFVFNALNSIQYHINKQDRATASKYLTSFAKLIRRNLDASQNDTTSLSEELERLELYLQLEHMRFKDRFRYRVEVAPGLDLNKVRLPAMMLQPYVENSIWHGILPAERQGEVHIAVRPGGPGRVQVFIEDDGVGVEHSLRSKADGGDHISRGIEITKGRADVLRRLHLTDIRITGPDQRQDPSSGAILGTQVVIELPVDA